MKIRIGFVSNSSSSSFVAIIDSEAYAAALNVAHPYTKAVVKALNPKKVTIADTDLIVITTYSGKGGDGTFNSLNVDYDDEMLNRVREEDAEELYPMNVFDEFLESIPEDMIHQHEDYNWLILDS